MQLSRLTLEVDVRYLLRSKSVIHGLVRIGSRCPWLFLGGECHTLGDICSLLRRNAKVLVVEAQSLAPEMILQDV